MHSIWRSTQVFQTQSLSVKYVPNGVGDASGERAGPSEIGPIKTYQKTVIILLPIKTSLVTL